MRLPTRSLCTLALLAGGLCAQTQTVYWNDGSATTGSANAFPWGSEGIRYQSIMTAAQVGGKPGFINDILLCNSYSTQQEAKIGYGDIEIRMGMTTQTTVTTSWSTNNPKPTTVYRGPLRLNLYYQQWLGLGLPKPFLYLPNTTTGEVNLCIEVIVWKVDDRGGWSGTNFFFPSASGNVNRAFLYQWTTNQTGAPNVGTSGSRWGLVFNDGNFSWAGFGCTGSNNKEPEMRTSSSGWPQLGQAFPLTVTNGPASSGAILILGGDFAKFAGVVPLPFDLAPLGAPKCMVWNDNLLAIPIGTDSSGAAKLPITVPLSAPGHLRLYAHWWCLDKGANKLGLTTSELGNLLY